MTVLNDITFDSRVQKEAASLGTAGYEVAVVGLQSKRAPHAMESTTIFCILRIKEIKISLRNLLTYFYSAFTFGNPTQKKLYDTLVSLKSDYYHAHDLNTLLPSFRAAQLNQATLIYDSHELFTESIRTRSANILIRLYNFLTRVYFAYIERKYIVRADRVITVNDQIATILSRKYSIPKPIVLLNTPKTANLPSSFDIRTALHLDRSLKLIIYQGGQDASRAVEETIESMRYVQGRACLVIMVIGNRDKLVSRTKELGLGEKVKFLDPVPPEQLVSYITSCDIGIIPFKIDNLNKKYGLPNKLFEYMAASIAVAATEQPVIKEIIDTYGIGTYFLHPTPLEIADAINRLLSADLAATKERAYQAFLQHFNWEHEEQKLLKLYDSLS